jgi:probable addiction module antidote protein
MSGKIEAKNKKVSPVGEDFDDVVVEQLRNDPAFRVEYIKSMVNETNPQLLVMSLQRVVEAIGGVGIVAKATGLNRTNLYRVLSGTVSPEYITLSKILDFIGMHFTVEINKKPQMNKNPAVVYRTQRLGFVVVKEGRGKFKHQVVK